MFAQAPHVREFLVGGKAVLTIKSRKTGKHFTYRISKKDEPGRRPVFFVGVLADGDNEGAFRYLGMFEQDQAVPNLRLTSKSHATAESPSVLAFRYLLQQIYVVGQIPLEQLEVYHEGKCCKCARKLTHPISLVLGIGPECGAERHALYAESVRD